MLLARRSMTKTELDLLGLKCPLPALKTGKALKALKSGDRLVVLCNDPMAEIDIPNLLRETGDRLINKAQRDQGLRFEIEKV
jgi:tRNA 2-thiouridine synthesizing protein A